MSPRSRREEERPPPPSREEVEEALRLGEVDINPAGQFYDTTSWRPMNLEEAKRGELTVEPPRYLPRTDGRCLVYAGRAHSFFGDSESLKSWAALLACASVLEGGETALYLDFETEPLSWIEKAVAVGVDLDDVGVKLAYIRPEEPLKAENASAWDLEAALRTVRPALIVIDGVSEAYALHNWDINSATDAVRYQHLLLRGFPGLATLEIDHTAKDPGRGQLGTQHKRAGVDAAVHFFPEQVEGRGGHSIARLDISTKNSGKDRYGRLREFAHDGRLGELHVDDTGERTQVYVAPPEPQGAAREAAAEQGILAHLREHPGQTKTEIREAVGRSSNLVDRLLQDLVEDEVLTLTREGNRKMYSVNGQ